MGLYTEAADIISKVKAKKASVKTLVLSKSSFPNKKQLYALVCETLKNTELLKKVEDKLCLLKKEEILGGNEDLLYVLLYDQLIGRGIKGSHNYRIAIQRYRSALKAEYKKLKAEYEPGPQTHKTDRLPRYARVNLLRTTVDDVLGSLKEEGWRVSRGVTKDGQGSVKFAERVSELREDEVLLDPHLSDLLVFPPGTDLHDHWLCQKGEIILQDKASCFPAHILAPPEGASVIDCCAAPGNKTSHIASLMRNSGKIFAFDKSESRLSTMTSLLSKAGVTSAEIHRTDFLRVNPTDPAYKDVGYVLVDPSCSGSGMVHRLNEKTEDSAERLTSLSNFQISVLKHALSFRSVQRVVYSTCSIYQEENEVVVDEVLSQFKGKFKLREVQPDWPHRGVKGNPCWKECIRMSPDLNLTNGFFVASFERIVDKTATTTDVRDTADVNLSGEDIGRKHKKQKKNKHKKSENAGELEADISLEKSHESGELEPCVPKKKHKKSKKHSKDMENENSQIDHAENCSGTLDPSFTESQLDHEEKQISGKKKRKHEKSSDTITVENNMPDCGSVISEASTKKAKKKKKDKHK